MAPTKPICQFFRLISSMRTPSAKSMIGMHASPSIFNALNNGTGNATRLTETATPSIMAIIIGLARNFNDEVWAPCRPISMILMPTEKYTRLQAMNNATADGSPAAPKASTASGNPMLPQLLYIIGGTKVRTS